MLLRSMLLLELLLPLVTQPSFDDPDSGPKKPARVAEVVPSKPVEPIKGGITADVGLKSLAFRSGPGLASPDQAEKQSITADVGKGTAGAAVEPAGLATLDLNRDRYTILYPNPTVKPETAVTWTVTWPTDAKKAAIAKQHIFSQEFVPLKKGDKPAPFPGWGWREGDLRADVFSPKTDLSDSLFLAVRADEKGAPLDNSVEIKLIVSAAVPEVPDPATPSRIKFKTLGTILVRIPAVTAPPLVDPNTPVDPSNPDVSDITKSMQTALAADNSAGQNAALPATTDFPAENADARLARVYNSAATLVERTDPASSPPKTVGELLAAMNRLSDKALLPEKPQLANVREAISKAVKAIGFSDTSKSLTAQDRANAAALFRAISKSLKPN